MKEKKEGENPPWFPVEMADCMHLGTPRRMHFRMSCPRPVVQCIVTGLHFGVFITCVASEWKIHTYCILWISVLRFSRSNWINTWATWSDPVGDPALKKGPHTSPKAFSNLNFLLFQYRFTFEEQKTIGWLILKNWVRYADICMLVSILVTQHLTDIADSTMTMTVGQIHCNIYTVLELSICAFWCT